MTKSGLYLLALFSAAVLGQQDTSVAGAQPPEEAPVEQVDTTPLRELGDEYQNSIKLLQNRFRIDYRVDEITMVFFRKFGSSPVVLVAPDGSKIFQSQADGENVFWYDAATYDLISIKNPTPGPWQAVGQILPESRVMVLTDLALHAKPLPDVIFSGEILKQTATLSNGGEPINYAEFRDVVSMDIHLQSTNNPNFNNFGAEQQTIASFEDNGRGMDEAPLDGVFTGQFNLAVPEGEWTPVFEVSTPLFTREQRNPPIQLYPNPIKIDVLLNGGGEGYHKLMIDADREHVDMNTLLVDGKVRFPNGDVQNFSLTEQSPDVREHMVINYDYGVYRVKLTAYGNTVTGRDFILDVPEYTILAEAPQLAETPDTAEDTEGVEGAQDVVMDGALPLMDDMAAGMSEEPQGMSHETMMTLIIAINGTLLVIGGGVIFFLTRSKQVPEAEQDVAPKAGLIAKLVRRLPFGKKHNANAEQEVSGETVNLAMPKE